MFFKGCSYKKTCTVTPPVEIDGSPWKSMFSIVFPKCAAPVPNVTLTIPDSTNITNQLQNIYKSTVTLKLYSMEQLRKCVKIVIENYHPSNVA